MTIHEFKVPDIGEGLAEVSLIEWLVGVGSKVVEHQLLASVESAKSIVELPSPFTGTVAELCWEPGDTVPVGATLITIEVVDDEPTPVMPDTNTPFDATEARATPSQSTTSGATDAIRLKAPPPVRRLARDLKVDLATVTPTGPEGRITANDVFAHAGYPTAGSTGTDSARSRRDAES